MIEVRKCLTCGTSFTAKCWNKVYCSQECQHVGQYGTKEKPCPICGKLIPTKRTTCSRSCAGKIPKDQTVRKSPEFLKKLSDALKASYQKESGDLRRKTASERMKIKNPSHNRATVEKITETRRINGTLGTLRLHRGGNGKLTEPQITVAAMFPGSVMELAIATKMGGTGYAPNAYKVDVGIPEVRIAIELDGHSHNGPRQRALDHKKDSVLTTLGWEVIRIKNEEVSINKEETRKMIQSRIDHRKSALQLEKGCV